MNDSAANDYSLPSRNFLQDQAKRLAAARARLLRNVDIARRRSILDLGCGYGSTVEELSRRSGGRVVALDRRINALKTDAASFGAAQRVCGDAGRLPFADDSFDLIFCQFFFLWANSSEIFDEVARVLRKGGVITAVEPDFGGMIEHPPEIATRDIWISGLRRAGADVSAARRMIVELRRRDFETEVALSDRIEAASEERFDWLQELPLLEEERRNVANSQSASKRLKTEETISHLPLVFLSGAKR